MQNHLKLLSILTIGGFGAGIFSAGDFKSLNLEHINLQEILHHLDTMDFGPLNGLVNDMKEAVRYAWNEAPKLLQSLKQGK